MGILIAYLGIPAFIVTLGGLLVWRGAAFLLARGETISPVDCDIQQCGRRALRVDRRRRKLGHRPGVLRGRCGADPAGTPAAQAFQFPLRPAWAETFLAVTGCGVIVGFVILVNSYPWPKGIVRQYADGQQHRDAGRGDVHQPRLRDPGSDPMGVGIAMTIPHDPHTVWPLCLRHWRQPRGGRAGRDQHPMVTSRFSL